LRFLIFYLGGDSDGHIQSLILAAVMIGIGIQVGVLAFVADICAHWETRPTTYSTGRNANSYRFYRLNLKS
jgi:hypothetical protein